MEMQQQITKDMVIAEVISQYPFAAELMQTYGLSCTGCSANTMDTIESGAKSHGMADQAIADMLTELNEVIAKGGTYEPPPASAEPLHITPKAAEKMAGILRENGKAGWGIRVSVSSGGCAGFMYGMDFAQQASEQDQVVDAGQVKIFVDAHSAKLLGGVTIDFVETLKESGFKFENPNAKASCGCGQSFH